MSISLVLNFTAITKYLLTPLRGKQQGLDFLLESVKKIYDFDFSKVAIFKEDSEINLTEVLEKLKSAGFSIKFLKENSNNSLLTLLQDEKVDQIIYLQGDAPFWDFHQTKEMIEKHKNYGVQFSNADGYPQGLFPEILSTEIIPALKNITKEERSSVVNLLKGEPIFNLLAVDINQFDIETQVAPKDYSLLRINLVTRSLRKSLLCQKVAEKLVTQWENTTLTNILLSLLDENPQWQRSRPAFYNLQITAKCPQKCAYCPWPQINPNLLTDDRLMTPMQLENLVQKISDYSDNAVVSFSLFGEPSQHPEIEKMINIVLKEPNLTLLIESSGIGWNEEMLKRVAEKTQDRLIWIISLDTDDERTYLKLRGDGYHEAKACAHLLTQLFGKNSYIQAIRMLENEEILPQFWNDWKKAGQVIVQKYDHFCHFLKENKVVDLSPVERFPCWHLKRDMNILHDGTVLLCREDLKSENSIGNAFEETFEMIFDQSQKKYIEQCNKKYSGICGDCDEFYTYNF